MEEQQEPRDIYSCSLQQVFDKILLGSEVKLNFESKQQYMNFRTMLLRKYKKYKDLLESIGADSNTFYQFIQCTFDSSSNVGQFKLALEHEKKKKPLSYYVKEL